MHMSNLKVLLPGACLLISIAAAPAARAQWSVVDIPATAQLVQQVQNMQRQLTIAGSQLQSAQLSLQSMTGGRGMQQLLGGTVRNYLPANWTQVTNAAQGSRSSGYPGLAADVQGAIDANAVLSPQRLATLSSADQRQIQAARRSSALQQALATEALANASSRFSSIQTLITAISSAADQKAILDLQARISAELGMLQNEQTKVQVLRQATQAQESTMQQQTRELVIDGHGRFETRFQPVP
jgi:type IV secretion system protein VirB5